MATTPIRDIRPNDIDSISALIQSMPGSNPRRATEIAEIGARRPVPSLPIHLRRRASVAGAFVDANHPASGAIVFASDPEAAWVLDIHWLGISPEARGHWIGQRLLESVESYAAAAGFMTINADVPIDDKGMRAYFLYQGYEVGEYVFLRSPDERHLPIPMVRTLTRGRWDGHGGPRLGADGIAAGDPRRV